jgi:septal ring factor EnvC (AmiA/AmiB activator)
MRKIAVALIAAFMMATTMPAIAAEMTKEQKDQCLLYSKSCVTEVDTIQKKIKKLNAEVKKGTKVYTPEELKKLNDKLKEAEDMLDAMQKGGQ